MTHLRKTPTAVVRGRGLGISSYVTGAEVTNEARNDQGPVARVGNREYARALTEAEFIEARSARSLNWGVNFKADDARTPEEHRNLRAEMDRQAAEQTPKTRKQQIDALALALAAGRRQ